MPVYVYRNLESGETFEVEQRITEPALSVHPETGAPVKRLIQPVGIAFKGSGFYVTDSRKQGQATLPASKSKTEAGSETKTESKAESKSETKTEKKSGDKKTGA